MEKNDPGYGLAIKCQMRLPYHNLVLAKGLNALQLHWEGNRGHSGKYGSLPPGLWQSITCELTAQRLGSALDPTLVLSRPMELLFYGELLWIHHPWILGRNSWNFEDFPFFYFLFRRFPVKIRPSPYNRLFLIPIITTPKNFVNIHPPSTTFSRYPAIPDKL